MRHKAAAIAPARIPRRNLGPARALA